MLAYANYGSAELIDPSVVRGLEYYTGPSRSELLRNQGRKGQPVRFGSVGGGGRYDGWSAASAARKCRRPASRSACRGCRRRCTAIGKLERRDARPGGRHRPRPRPHRRLSAHGSRRCARPASAPSCISAIRASLGQQMKYADRRSAPCAIIQGGDEKAQRRSPDQGPHPSARELAGESRGATSISPKQAEAQFAVPEESWSTRWAKLLARRGIKH